MSQSYLPEGEIWLDSLWEESGRSFDYRPVVWKWSDKAWNESETLVALLIKCGQGKSSVFTWLMKIEKGVNRPVVVTGVSGNDAY